MVRCTAGMGWSAGECAALRTTTDRMHDTTPRCCPQVEHSSSCGGFPAVRVAGECLGMYCPRNDADFAVPAMVFWCGMREAPQGCVSMFDVGGDALRVGHGASVGDGFHAVASSVLCAGPQRDSYRRGERETPQSRRGITRQHTLTGKSPCNLPGTRTHGSMTLTTRCHAQVGDDTWYNWWLQKSEREKPHCGETTQHAPTQTPCNQPATNRPILIQLVPQLWT